MVLTQFTQGGHEHSTTQDINERTKELLKRHHEHETHHESDQPKIIINEAVGRVAFFYERLRTFIDYKDEHLLRKSAIERIVKRLMLLHERPEEVAEQLIRELIAARYLENNTIPETGVKTVAEVIKKYTTTRDRLDAVYGKERGGELWDWFSSLMPVEIEQHLGTSNEERAFVNALMETVKDTMRIEGMRMSEGHKHAHVLLASYRAFLKSDHPMLEYHLFVDTYPDWYGKGSHELLEQIVHKMPVIHQGLHEIFRHPLQRQLIRMAQKIALLYRILWDIFHSDENAGELLESKEHFENAVRATYRKRYEQTRSKLRKSAFRSLIYILLTKMMVALALEYPYDVWIRHEVNYRALTINLLVPPLLMFLIALFIRFPKEKNTTAIVNAMKGLVTEGIPTGFERRVRVQLHTNVVVSFFYYLLYSALYVITFGLIIGGLYKMHFNVVSVLLFLFFLTVVSFFGFRIRAGLRELVVVESPSFLSYLAGLFVLPIVTAGRWLSLNVSKINIFIFIFDFIIETPLKVVLKVFEGFATFFREKKEEIDQN